MNLAALILAFVTWAVVFFAGLAWFDFIVPRVK